jgi:hypothetical protein
MIHAHAPNLIKLELSNSYCGCLFGSFDWFEAASGPVFEALLVTALTLWVAFSAALGPGVLQ